MLSGELLFVELVVVVSLSESVEAADALNQSTTHVTHSAHQRAAAAAGVPPPQPPTAAVRARRCRRPPCVVARQRRRRRRRLVLAAFVDVSTVRCAHSVRRRVTAVLPASSTPSVNVDYDKSTAT